MITLKISFLLAIKLHEVTPIPKAKPEKKGKKEKHQGTKSKDKSTASKSVGNKSKSKATTKKKVGKKEEEEEDETYSVIEVTNPISYIHLDYDLFGKKFKYSADVVCWDTVAKIFTKHGTKCFKTIVREDVIWVPVFLEHYLNPLTTEEIRKLLQQVIVLHVDIGQNYVAKKAQLEKSSKFYLHKDDASNDYFPEVLSKKPDKAEPYKEQMDKIWKKLLTFPMNREIVTWMYNMDDVHTGKIVKILTQKSLGKEIHYKDFYDDGDKVDKKGKKKHVSEKNSKKSKKSKASGKKQAKEVSQKLDFKIPAHVLLSDPVLATYQVKDTGTRLDELYILLSSDNMLTNAQKLELCPLLVKIRKINNLPEDILKANGFKNVYVNCNIPGITQFKTSFRPLRNTVHFEESRFIITTDYPSLNTVQLLETRRVITKIIGVKETSATPESANVKQKKHKKSKQTKKSKSSTSFKNSGKAESDLKPFELAGASFDLSSLVNTYFLYKEKGQCCSVKSLPPETRPEPRIYFMDRFTMNEVHLNNLEQVSSNSPLTDPTMFFNGTLVKFEARFLIPTFAMYRSRDASQSYKRLLLIMHNRELAKLLLGAVMLHNHGILGGGPLLVPNCLTQQRIFTLGVSPKDTHKLISGFCIDDSTSFILYVEGPSNGYILVLLHEVSGLNYSTAKVFYNSEYIFPDRLFVSFYNYSGIFSTTLKLPLADIFSDQKSYVVGNVPIHCRSVIQKLNLMVNSTTFKSILSYDLLPTEIELLSFSVEYGFQIRYKGVETDVDEYKRRTVRSSTDLFRGMSVTK